MNVRIVNRPSGRLPDSILQEWVGLIMPVATKQQMQDLGILSDVVQSCDYVVMGSKALEALRLAGKFETFSYYKDAFEDPSFVGGKYVRFSSLVCEVVSA